MKYKNCAILGGGDWADASCEHLLIPESVNLEEEKKKHADWYDKVYLPKLRADKSPDYMSFTDWLKKLGAKEDKNIIEFWEI